MTAKKQNPKDRRRTRTERSTDEKAQGLVQRGGLGGVGAEAWLDQVDRQNQDRELEASPGAQEDAEQARQEDED